MLLNALKNNELKKKKTLEAGFYWVFLGRCFGFYWAGF